MTVARQVCGFPQGQGQAAASRKRRDWLLDAGFTGVEFCDHADEPLTAHSRRMVTLATLSGRVTSSANPSAPKSLRFVAIPAPSSSYPLPTDGEALGSSLAPRSCLGTAASSAAATPVDPTVPIAQVQASAPRPAARMLCHELERGAKIARALAWREKEPRSEGDRCADVSPAQERGRPIHRARSRRRRYEISARASDDGSVVDDGRATTTHR